MTCPGAVTADPVPLLRWLTITVQWLIFAR